MITFLASTVTLLICGWFGFVLSKSMTRDSETFSAMVDQEEFHFRALCTYVPALVGCFLVRKSLEVHGMAGGFLVLFGFLAAMFSIYCMLIYIKAATEAVIEFLRRCFFEN